MAIYQSKQNSRSQNCHPKHKMYNLQTNYLCYHLKYWFYIFDNIYFCLYFPLLLSQVVRLLLSLLHLHFCTSSYVVCTPQVFVCNSGTKWTQKKLSRDDYKFHIFHFFSFHIYFNMWSWNYFRNPLIQLHKTKKEIIDPTFQSVLNQPHLFFKKLFCLLFVS